MNQARIALLVFSTTLLLMVYQNCQKTGFSESASNSVFNITESNKFASFELTYGAGYIYCMKRCLTSAKIGVDLESGQIQINTYHMSSEAEVNVESVQPPPVAITLNPLQLANLKGVTNEIEFEIHQIPSCETGGFCGQVMDNSSFNHKFTDQNKVSHLVFTEQLIDPNLHGTEIWIFKSGQEKLTCALKKIISESSILSNQIEDSIEGLETSMGYFTPLQCP